MRNKQSFLAKLQGSFPDLDDDAKRIVMGTAPASKIGNGLMSVLLGVVAMCCILAFLVHLTEG